RLGYVQACFLGRISFFGHYREAAVVIRRSPKLNGHVERAQRTHTEEFYDLYMGELDLKSVNEALRDWEVFYNTVRPHHSLDLKTPEEYLYEYHSDLAPIPKPSHMS
ncbi:MAG: hypothetical protein E3J69_04895, partial [Anaerolineales bacterium]